MNILYVRPDNDLEEYGYLSWSDVSSTDVTGDGRRMFDLSRDAKGECQAGQSDTVQRSNFRSLQRDYPDVFVTISYSNVDVLAIFEDVLNANEDIQEVLRNLNDYCLYDEDDLSQLEMDEIHESFGQYLADDIRRHYGLTEGEVDAWDAIPADRLADLWWRAISELDIYPEHDGFGVVWDDSDVARAARLVLALALEG